MHLRGVSGGACKEDEFSARLSGENGVRDIEKSCRQLSVFIIITTKYRPALRYVIVTRKIIYIKILITSSIIHSNIVHKNFIM